MHAEHLQITDASVMSDPEWIALESLDENISRFIFADDMLVALEDRGLVRPDQGRWRVTDHGRRALKWRRL